MPANENNIWQVPAYLPYLQPPLTDAAISNAEKVLGYKIPEEMLALLRKQNGGYIRYSLPDMVHDSIAGIGPHFPSLLNFDWEQVQEYVSYPLQGLVPFDGDGHWHLCLDYRGSSERPSIAYVDIECDDCHQIAASFSEYLLLLRLKVKNELVFESDGISETLKELGVALAIPFEYTGNWDYGYTTYRAALGNVRSPGCLWVSPNKVVRGFVREDDSRYAELKVRLPGSGRRYPEVSDDAWIVNVTEGMEQKVVDAFKKCGISLRPLKDVVDAAG